MKKFDESSREALAEAKNKLKDAGNSLREAAAEALSAFSIETDRINRTMKHTVTGVMASAASAVSSAAKKVSERADEVSENMQQCSDEACRHEDAFIDEL